MNQESSWCILDANWNRIREALRVVEDILRFTWHDQDLSVSLKDLRHKYTAIWKDSIEERKMMIQFRDILKDEMYHKNHKQEMIRTSLSQVLLANIQRAKESARVLEEVSKVNDTGVDKKPSSKSTGRLKSEQFQSLRAEIYDLEQIIIQKYSKIIWENQT